MSTYIPHGDAAVPKYDDICPDLRDFLKHLVVVDGRSNRTANLYYTTLRMFLRYIRMTREQLSEDSFDEIQIRNITSDQIRQITRKDISDFMYFLAEKGNSEKTRKDKLTTLRSFFMYLVNEKGFPENPALYVDMPKSKKRVAKYLDLSQTEALLQAAKNRKEPERDYCITVLFLTCGLRLSELCGLNTDSFTEDKTFRIIGKGNKERIGYLNDTNSRALQDWLDVRAGYGLDKEEKALFVSKHTKKRLTERAVEKIIDGELAMAGLSGQGYSVHKLRHTAATMMYEHGAGLMELKEILGHEHTTTTEIYTHVNSRRLHEIAENMDEVLQENQPIEK